ncbi:MAG: TraB/GumN family protein [Helicobacteraceae bacterium]|nr:TraB/GumN family protein [Helicobacteraceae bacterium]
MVDVWLVVANRNARLTERLLTRIDRKKPIFVAIGALHLGGDKGVLALLCKTGFKITRPQTKSADSTKKKENQCKKRNLYILD